MLTAHTRVEVEGAVDREPFEARAGESLAALWEGIINPAPAPQEVDGTVEFKYRHLDTPVAEVDLECVAHPLITATAEATGWITLSHDHRDAP